MSLATVQRSGRRMRGGADVTPIRPPVSAGLTGGQYKPLTDPEMARIHELVLQLLADLGLSQITPTLEARALAAGCWMDSDGRLHFPPALVEDVIAKSRRNFILHGIDPRHDIEIGGKRVHMGTGGAAPTIMDFDSGKYRESTVSDLYDIARLVDRLDNIHWYLQLSKGTYVDCLWINTAHQAATLINPQLSQRSIDIDQRAYLC